MLLVNFYVLVKTICTLHFLCTFAFLCKEHNHVFYALLHFLPLGESAKCKMSGANLVQLVNFYVFFLLPFLLVNFYVQG